MKSFCPQFTQHKKKDVLKAFEKNKHVLLTPEELRRNGQIMYYFLFVWWKVNLFTVISLKQWQYSEGRKYQGKSFNWKEPDLRSHIPSI